MSLAVTGSVSPFAFTSDKELSETGSWFLMWINPQTLNYIFQNQQSGYYIEEGYGYQHWQAKLPRLSFTGISGYIFGSQTPANYPSRGVPESFDPSSGTFAEKTNSGAERYQNAVTSLTNSFRNGSGKEAASSNYQGMKAFGSLEKTSVIYTGSVLYYKRLQKIALEEKFYFDYEKGYKKFNKKYLKIFTKNHPQGLQITGFFDSFDINEDAMDVMAIPYSTQFVVESGLENDSFDEIEMTSYFESVKEPKDLPKLLKKFKEVSLISGEGYIAKNLILGSVKISAPVTLRDITSVFSIDFKEGIIRTENPLYENTTVNVTYRT